MKQIIVYTLGKVKHQWDRLESVEYTQCPWSNLTILRVFGKVAFVGCRTPAEQSSKSAVGGGAQQPCPVLLPKHVVTAYTTSLWPGVLVPQQQPGVPRIKLRAQTSCSCFKLYWGPAMKCGLNSNTLFPNPSSTSMFIRVNLNTLSRENKHKWGKKWKIS